MPARFVLYEDRAEQWRWRLVAGNGRIVADSGESYTRQEDARRGIDRVTAVAPTADRLQYGQPHFEVYEDREERWRWRLVASNGRIIADSGQGYATKSGATGAIDTVNEYLTDERGIETYQDEAETYRW